MEKEYRILTKASDEMLKWWPPELNENGWLPYDDTYNSIENALEDKSYYKKDFPEEEFKIQERKIGDWKEVNEGP